MRQEQVVKNLITCFWTWNSRSTTPYVHFKTSVSALPQLSVAPSLTIKLDRSASSWKTGEHAF